jgi:hypothetical protein
MTDYYPVISAAVAALDSNTSELRGALYDRARAALRHHFEKLQTPESEVETERLSLEAAIQRVEDDIASGGGPLPPSEPTDYERSRLEQSALSEVEPEGRASGAIGSLIASSALGAIFAVAIILLAFVPAVYWHGAPWALSNALHCLTWPVNITFILCLFVLLPLLLSQATRPLSTLGLVAASFVFAAATAMTAVVATQSHFGTVWTVIGLLGFIIGIVPIGLIAAITNADWLAVGLICEGIVLAFSSRLFAEWLSNTASSELEAARHLRHRLQRANFAVGNEVNTL